LELADLIISMMESYWNGTLKEQIKEWRFLAWASSQWSVGKINHPSLLSVTEGLMPEIARSHWTDWKTAVHGER
jgi:hypothetical protein